MILLCYRKNILKFLFATIILFLLTDIQQKSREKYETYNEYDLYNYAYSYVNENSDNFYEKAHSDKQKYFNKRVAIEFMENRQELDEEDRFALLMGEYRLTLSDVVWINTQYNKQGDISPTVYYDNVLMDMIIEEYQPRWNLTNIVQNEITLDHRNLRRYNPSEYNYKLSEIRLKAASKIDLYYNKTSPSFGITFYLSRFEGDLFMPILIALLCFSIFSKLRENGYLKYIATLKIGINRFAIKQYFAGFLLTLSAFAIYVTGYLIYANTYLPDLTILSAPIQIINGYQDFVYPLTIGGYILLSINIKLLFTLFIYSITSIISLVSKNSIISFALNLLLLLSLWSVSTTINDGAFKGILSGNLGVISAEQYVNIFDIPVYSPVVLIIAYILPIGIIAMAMYLFSRKLCNSGN